MQFNEIERNISRSLRRQMLAAFVVCGILVGGFGGAAAYSEINGAVIASGKIIVLGRAKHVEHSDGGIIGEILVSEGQRVAPGQLLFRLDGTMARANLGIVESQLAQLLAQEARLLAEQAGRPDIAFPEDMGADWEDRKSILIDAQIKLLEAREITRLSQKTQLAKQIRQLEEQVAALHSQRKAVEENLALVDDQIRRFTSLSERGLIVHSQLVEIQREKASLLGSQAALTSEIVEIQQETTQTELKRIQVDEAFSEAVLTELDQKRVEIARLKEERVAAQDKINRLEIRAPMGGYLHQLNVHTVGSVVDAGETLVQVIPMDDELIIEASLSPADIDQVYPEQDARIRLTGLNQRVTPELMARVIDVSPDLTTDERTGNSFYTARLRIPNEEIGKIGAEVLKPGMPSEVFIQTGSRTILSYMIRPISDQIRHAMRES